MGDLAREPFALQLAFGDGARLFRQTISAALAMALLDGIIRTAASSDTGSSTRGGTALLTIVELLFNSLWTTLYLLSLRDLALGKRNDATALAREAWNRWPRRLRHGAAAQQSVPPAAS